MNKLKQFLKNPKDFVITKKEKAAVGFLVGAIGAYFVQSGLTVKDIWSWNGVSALVVGVITHLFVYFTPNSQ